MIFRGAILLALLLGGLFAPPAGAAPVPAASRPAQVAQATAQPLAVQAAKKRPRANLTASAVVLASGKVRVSLTSNAKKVKLTYRSAKNKKRTATIKIRKGAGAKTLSKGSKKIYAQARTTKALRTSVKVRVLPTGEPVGAIGALTRVDVGPTGHEVACYEPNGARAVPWTPECDQPFDWPGSMPNSSAWSPDGTKIAFVECASTSGNCHVFVKDLTTGGVSQVSTAADGVTGGSGQAGLPVAFSPDGTQVAFQWYPEGGAALTPDAPTNDILLYVKTLGTGAITWYPRASPAVPWFRPVYGGDGESWRLPDEYDAWLSPDGGRVVFWTRLALNQADTDKVEDVYIRDLRTGSVTLVSTRADGTKLVGENTYGFWAPDGKRVLFKANGELHGLYIKELG